MNSAYSLTLIVLMQAGLIFEIDISPGEHTPVFEAVAKTLMLHEKPLASSMILQTVTVVPGQRIEFDDERYRTVKAGRIRVLADTSVTGRMIGVVDRLSRKDYYSDKFASVEIPVRLGTTFEYLQYRAEGSCFVRLDRKVLDANCPTVMKSMYKVEAEPRTELWIHVVLPSNSVGWLLVADSSVKEVGRE